ncbi:Alpha/Beta hydrolase protein [Plectosphaerella plurivora]|uniref:Carboxylic ester hydrolase n=1 Tax=Plectosphaerella plurivora TaxID=936078 RepID=A0A9P8VHU0_9PEZI|nr:Alpha/Beta hydrolase protein [Plectosphaerella plurivora]
MIAFHFLAFGLVIPLISAQVNPGQKPMVDNDDKDDDFLTTDTTSGMLTGRPSLWQPNVTQFLGIPYASPPIGGLRFAPPKPFLSREAINTEYFGPACPSHFFQNSNKTVPPWPMEETIHAQLNQFSEYFSEDCLTLNVWTRRGGGGGGEKRAVMVWVHGGGFFKGSAMWSGLRGAKLANDFDVVVVTVQFRLSVFGFPGADFLNEVNPGLLDLRLAVEWVRDNIEKFGGDPERITLCGQSSGASMVNEYAISHAEGAIAHAFVLQSGFGPWDAPRETRSREIATQSWYAVTKKMGCGGSEEGEATLGCMREKSWDEIMEAGMETYFAPTVDERTWSSNPDELMKEGKFAKKPVLMGNTADEGAYMTFLQDNPEFADDFFHAPHCASVNVAKSRALHGVPVWQYVYAGNYPNQDLGTGGAWHGSEIGMIFGTSENVSRRPPTPEQIRLSGIMGKAWTEFAKDPYRGLEGMGWPRYDVEDKVPSIIRLGERDSSEIVFEHVRDRTAECSRIGLT